MKVVVVGGSGFVGKNMIPILSKSYEVVNIDLNEFPTHVNGLKTIILDIKDSKSLGDIFSGELNDTDAIIHLAAVSREDLGKEDFENFFENNVVGTFNLLQSVKTLKLKKFVFASSFLAYGDAGSGHISEDSPLCPQSIYASTKASGESLIRAFSKRYNFKHIILRKSGIYGNGDNQKRVIDIFIDRALSDQPIMLFGDKVLDFVHVLDAVDAYSKSLDYNGSGVFNVGSGSGFSLDKIAKFIVNKSGSKSIIEYKDTIEGDVTQFIPSIDKAVNELGYDPKHDLYQFIENKINILRKN